MTHVARKKSESGFHHVVTKGDGGQIIFESDVDRMKYLRVLADALRDHKVKIHAYCLMSNHVHLLIEDKDDDLSAFMKQLNERYAMYYRWKTGRVGHVFQRPYWSEPIQTDERFLCTVRYIHANPEVAGICPLEHYLWSSYQAHLGQSPLVEVALTREMLGGVEQFESFSAAGRKYAKPFVGSKLRGHLSSDELLGIAKATVGKDMLPLLKTMKPAERSPYIAALKRSGLTEREISRFTGIGGNTVHEALANSNA